MSAATPDQTPRLTRRRRRPARSCDECRRRKVKCNRQMPCNHCTATKKHCVFSSASSKPSLAEGIGTSLVEHIGLSQVTLQQASQPVAESATSRGQYRLDPSRTETTLTQVYHQPNSAPEAHSSSRDLSSTSLRPNDRINELESRLRTLEHVLSRSIPNASVDTSGTASLVESGYASNPVLHGAKPILNKSRLFGRTHWTNDVPEVGLPIECNCMTTNDISSSNG